MPTDEIRRTFAEDGIVREKEPSDPVEVPVFDPLIRTVAFGTAVPLASVIVPVMTRDWAMICPETMNSNAVKMVHFQEKMRVGEQLVTMKLFLPCGDSSFLMFNN